MQENVQRISERQATVIGSSHEKKMYIVHVTSMMNIEST